MARWEAILIASIIALVIAVAGFGAYRGWHHTRPNSFDPNWDCIANPYADVCIKRIPPAR